jgi:hypothetical protein
MANCNEEEKRSNKKKRKAGESYRQARNAIFENTQSWHTVESRITRRTLLPGEAHHEREFSRVLSASFNKFDIGRNLWHKHHYIHTG